MSASLKNIDFANETNYRVLILTVFVLTSYFAKPACSLVNVSPRELLDILEDACFVAVTEFANVETLDLFSSLEKITFINENYVLFGSIKVQNFLWSEGEPLNLSPKEENPNILAFQKKKVDRTCLSKTNIKRYPKPIPYKGTLNLETLTDFINSKCVTYRQPSGNLNNKGLHRQEILSNLFSVSSVSNVTSKMFTESDVLFKKEPGNKNFHCEKDETSCNEIKSKDTNYRNDNLEDADSEKSEHRLPECEKIKMTSKNEFFHKYLKISKPVIIQNGIKDWPAFAKWTNKFLKDEYGDKDVHIKLTPGGEYEGVEKANNWEDFSNFKIPDEVKKQLPFPDLVVVRPATMDIKFSDFIDVIENVSSKVLQNFSAYLEYSSIPHYLPELEEDIEEIPFFEGILKRQHLNVWLSDGNTLGKLHFDAFDNFLCQISGRKQVILFEPHENSKLYESHIPEAILSYNRSTGQFRKKTLLDSTSMVMSPVDIRKINFERFPEFAETYPLNCTIDEGDVLFMPSFWWHEVQSYPNITAGRNLAINFWYEPFLIKEFPCPECKLDINPNYRHLL